MRAECGALVLSNVQPHAAVPSSSPRAGSAFRSSGTWRAGITPSARASSRPFCDVYVVQNEAMRDDLARFHAIGAERVVVTGWPQTDLYARRGPRGEYEGRSRSRGLGLDPRGRS